MTAQQQMAAGVWRRRQLQRRALLFPLTILRLLLLLQHCVHRHLLPRQLLLLLCPQTLQRCCRCHLLLRCHSPCQCPKLRVPKGG